VEAHPYGLRCPAMSENDCYNFFAGAFDSGVPVPMKLDLGGAWLYRVE
jgi:hypothetical protein